MLSLALIIDILIHSRMLFEFQLYKINENVKLAQMVLTVEELAQELAEPEDEYQHAMVVFLHGAGRGHGDAQGHDRGVGHGRGRAGG